MSFFIKSRANEMNVIFHIMQEEYERLQVVMDLYQAAIAKEVRGAPRLKPDLYP
jgi:hypothetical protein